MEAIETNYTTPTLPLHIAKVMKPLILGRDAGHSPYVTCISARPIDGGTQYIATNGHVMLMIDTTEPRPGLEHAAWSAEQVKTYIESKGHSPLVSDASLVHSLPAYDQVIPTGEPKPVTSFGVNIKYLAMMDKISRGLKISTAYWGCTFYGKLSPMVHRPNPAEGDTTEVWATQRNGDHEAITGVTFLVMPVRL